MITQPFPFYKLTSTHIINLHYLCQRRKAIGWIIQTEKFKYATLKPKLIKWICDKFFCYNKHFWELIIWSGTVIMSTISSSQPLWGSCYYPSFEDEEPEAQRVYIICVRWHMVELAYVHNLALEPTPLPYTDSLDKERILLSWKPEFTAVTKLSSGPCLEFCWQTWESSATQLWLLCLLSTIKRLNVFSWNVHVYCALVPLTFYLYCEKKLDYNT